jgi:serine/threonine protein kinase
VNDPLQLESISKNGPVEASVSVSDHKLLRPIARGAYGEVWLARNAVGTPRAVKIVLRDTHASRESFEREFKGLQKFEPVSRGHEGLVDILTLGLLPDGAGFYYVMELADRAQRGPSEIARVLESEDPGLLKASRPRKDDAYSPRTLRAELKSRGALPADQVIALGLKLTAALTHLHAQGLVHRDVKPSNILFIGGEPKLADAGLVTAMDDARSLVGTAGYIAPEGPGTAQADLYALGKVLYEAAFGKDRQEFPVLPANVASRSDHARLLELNEIVATACAHDPRHRYAQADEMGADLALLRQGQSVKRKRATERRASIVKKICIAALLPALTATTLVTMVHKISPDTSNSASRLSKNPLANKEYLEGVQCYRRDTKEGLAQGLDHFHRALKIDRDFTLAYAGLFEVYIGGNQLGLSPVEMQTKLRAYASTLLRLNGALAEAQAAQAWIDFLDRRWDAAEPRFRQAIRLDSKCAIAHMRYGFCLYTAGRPDEGLEELQIAEILDPTLPRIKKNIGNAFYVKRDFREAIKQYQKAVYLEPSYPVSHEKIARAWRALGNYTNAIDEFERYEILAGKDRTQVNKYFELHRRAYANGGPRGYWANYLAEAQRAGELYWQAACHANLGDYDQALSLLEKAYAANEPGLIESLLWDECWDPVHSELRFTALLKGTGLRK